MSDERKAPIELSDHEVEKVTGGGGKKPTGPDYFLKINGVDGESTDDKHKAEIQ